jgi:hypothetical protein
MLEMARKKSPVTELEELPASLKALKGFDRLVFDKSGAGAETATFGNAQTEYPSGTWVSNMSLPADLEDLGGELDPLLIAVALSAAAYQVETKLTEVVRFCRSEGKTWTQIGEALGMSKQAAWERFSGED